MANFFKKHLTLYSFFQNRVKRATAYPRSKSTCDCRAQGLADCNYHRIYAQPDCNLGWDSSREKHFTIYGLCSEQQARFTLVP